MPSRYEVADIGPIIDEIGGDNDRAAIIVGAAITEYLLQDIIEATLPPLNSDESARIFSEYGLLGTFSAKILWAYTISQIGRDTKHDLDMIRLIRNESAHNANPASFTTDKIRNRALTLRIAADHPDAPDAAKRFRVTAKLYLCALAYRAAELRNVAGPEADADPEAIEFWEACKRLAPRLKA